MGACNIQRYDPPSFFNDFLDKVQLIHDEEDISIAYITQRDQDGINRTYKINWEIPSIEEIKE